VTHLRPADAGDVDAVAALEQAVFGADAWSAASVHAELTGPARQALVAVADDGGLRGYVVVRTPADPADPADLHRIAVTAQCRRRGLAARLLAACESAAYDRMLLEVRADNSAAIAFYRRQKFTEIARRRAYYADGADAVVMQRRHDRPAGLTDPSVSPAPRR
jgi:[ribosomal protein S18]-alanine N-acetyltransferase